MAADTTASALVFSSRTGRIRRSFKTRYFEAVARLGLGGPGIARRDRVNIHSLRHTWASRLAESSGDLLLVQQLGDWSSLALVQRYAHLRAGRGAEALKQMDAARPKLAPATHPRPLRQVRRKA